jgi:hypothetical protein
MLFFGALNNESYILGRAIGCLIPLLTSIFVIVKLFADTEGGIDPKVLFEIFDYGLWLALVTLLVLLFYTPKAKK